MRLFEVKKVCPDAVYASFGLRDLQAFSLSGCLRYSGVSLPDVEEYSIDEAFVDLTGLRRSYHGPYGHDRSKDAEDC